MPRISNDRRDRVRRAIIDAAADCFADKGFAATSISEICAAANMSVGGIYRHFAGKDELVDAVSEAILTPVIEALDTAAHGPDVLDTAEVIDLLHTTLLQCAPGSEPRLMVGQFWAELLRDPTFPGSRQELGTALRAGLTRLVVRANPDTLEPDRLTAALMAIGMGVFLSQSIDDTETSTRELIDAISVLLRHNLPST
ncbi:TetR/AcrR family transcriptional regulator [Streptomyces sp. NPDC093149]|uniref:TetR/AcrR family transcriptional regulator n=1 Tax=Streptomyces sp. NPDC093149 TaxID=3366031 RepID=UPI0037F90ABD